MDNDAEIRDQALYLGACDGAESDRVKALEAEVSSLKELAQRYHDEAARDLEIRVKTVEVRKAQLRRHGTHTGDCKRFGTPPECTCGWTAIAEGLHGD